MKHTHALLILSAVLLAVSCGKKTTMAEENAADTIAVQEPEILPDTIAVQEPEILPDTMFASAQAVDFAIERADTATAPGLHFLGSEYTDTLSALTFRASNLRDADFGGRIKGKPTKIVTNWMFTTAANRAGAKFGPWGGGTGWTGQPLHIHWPDSVYQRMKTAPGVTADFAQDEIIVASLAGEVYFINPDNGKATRKPLDAGAPIKGTPSLDPSMNGNLYVGQGVPVEGQRFGCEAFNLFTMERFFFLERDPKARRNWNAFDSSPVSAGGFLFWPGENGTLYKYTRGQGELKLHSAMRHSIGGAAPGMESSMAVYANYGYVSDNHGNLLCINLNTLKPVWRYHNQDDTDSSPVIEVEDGHPYVYSGCEVDKRGDGATARIVKLDGLTGQELWLAEEPCHRWHCNGEKYIDGGVFGTPLPGKGNCSQLFFVNICKHGKEQGIVVAYDKKSGQERFRTQLKHYAWSSMVPFYNERQEMYIFLGDCIGNIYLIDAHNGQIIYTEHVGNNFESSPTVFQNACFLGSRGNGIYKFSIE